MCRSKQLNIAEVSRYQFLAAKIVSAHENVAQLAVRLKQCVHAFVIQLNHFARFTHAYLNQNRTTKQNVCFSGELTGTSHRNDSFRIARRLNKLQLAAS